MNHLKEDFLYELFKLFFRNKSIIEICKQHLKYHYLPNEAFKSIFKQVLDYYSGSSKTPTIGIISQQYSGSKEGNVEALRIIGEIKKIETPEEETILRGLEIYIKEAIFRERYDKFYNLFNKGEKEKLYDLLLKSGEEIANFSLLNNVQQFEELFGHFSERNTLRQSKSDFDNYVKKKLPFSIDEIDKYTNGGSDEGDLIGILARSGTGKSTFLRHIGVNAARKGFKGLHLQLEGTLKKCEDAYDASWTAQSIENIEMGNIDPIIYDELFETSQQVIAAGGEIDIIAYEAFGSCTVPMARQILLNYEKKYGRFPDYFNIDYLELLDPADGVKYDKDTERFRRIAIARKLKNLAVETKTRIFAPTQASDVTPENYNDPLYIMTRSNISECKGLTEPFSFFFTLNQTNEEYEAGIMRIYGDKIRDHKRNWVVKIIQALEYHKFYDRARTLREFHNQIV